MGRGYLLRQPRMGGVLPFHPELQGQFLRPRTPLYSPQEKDGMSN